MSALVAIIYLLYALMGMALAAQIMIWGERGNKFDDSIDRFFGAVILIVSCGLAWPLIGAAVVLIKIARYSSVDQ